MFNDFIKRRKFNSMSLSDQVDAVLKDPYDIRFIIVQQNTPASEAEG